MNILSDSDFQMSRVRNESTNHTHSYNALDFLSGTGSGGESLDSLESLVLDWKTKQTQRQEG